MACRRDTAQVRAGILGALWPLAVDIVFLLSFAVLIMGIVVASAYAELRNDGPWPMVAMFGGIVVFATCLSLALVTTWRAVRQR